MNIDAIDLALDPTDRNATGMVGCVHRLRYGVADMNGFYELIGAISSMDAVIAPDREFCRKIFIFTQLVGVMLTKEMHVCDNTEQKTEISIVMGRLFSETLRLLI